MWDGDDEADEQRDARQSGGRHGGAGRELVMMQWGLVPSWAKDASIGSSLINARSDTVASKPAFRFAFKRRRCLVPVSGFYEWQQLFGDERATALDTQSSLFDMGGSPPPTKPRKPRANSRTTSPRPMAAPGLRGLVGDVARSCGEGECTRTRWLGVTDPTTLETFTIITTEPNELMRTLHDRMSVLLDPADFDARLDSKVDAAAL